MIYEGVAFSRNNKQVNLILVKADLYLTQAEESPWPMFPVKIRTGVHTITA